jgi:TonB family protein
VPRADVPLAPGGTLLVPQRLLSTSVPAPERPTDPGAPPPTAQVVSNLVTEGLRKGKVERGLVHPYFSALGKSLLQQWDAERAVSAKGLSGFIDQAKGNTGEWLRVWSERATTYGATGAALASDRQPQRRPAAGDPNIEARRELRDQMHEQFRATRRAVIRVVQDPQGRLLSAELVVPSSNAQVDREAVSDVRAAAERLPPPPPEAVGGRATLTSLWQFELIVSISPPVPTFSFEFDEALGFVDSRMPLDRRIYKRVRLLEAY